MSEAGKPGGAWGLKLLALPVAVLAVLSLHTAFIYGMADVKTLKARALIADWQRNEKARPQIVQVGLARNDLIAGLKWLPGDSQLLEGLGYLYGLRAVNVENIPELHQAMLDEVLLYYRESLKRRPMAPYAWANVALALHLKDAGADEMWRSFDRAMAYGKREGGVQLKLARIALDRWSTLTPERRGEVVDMLGMARGRTVRDLKKMFENTGHDDLQIGPEQPAG
ncbi:MAG: hypothetical protein LWW83_00810 [Azonexaceae bacterium]|nr:hypothetical protein [Azonexaceae bacterium]